MNYHACVCYDEQHGVASIYHCCLLADYIYAVQPVDVVSACVAAEWLLLECTY
jgi:hypothetical protein